MALADEYDEILNPIIFNKQSSPGLGMLSKNVGSGLSFQQKSLLGGHNYSNELTDSSHSMVKSGPLGT